MPVRSPGSNRSAPVRPTPQLGLHVEFRHKLFGFKEMDFKVKLGSIVESDTREYYATNRFSYLKEKLTSLLSNSH